MSTRRSFVGSTLLAAVGATLGVPRFARAAPAFPQLRAWNLLREDVQLAASFAGASRDLVGDVGSSMQPIVEGAMRGIVKDDATRRRYLLLYGDKPPMLAHFGHPREDQILVLLLDASGDVLWRGSGAWSETTETSLRIAIAA